MRGLHVLGAHDARRLYSPAGPPAAPMLGPFSGSVSGSWSTPVLSGNLEDGATGALTPTDNTTTAQCNLGCALSLPGYPATTLAWGNGASAPPATSTLSFTGSPFTQQHRIPSSTLGTFTYLNGVSDTNSLIFGATLTLTLKDQSGRRDRHADDPAPDHDNEQRRDFRAECRFRAISCDIHDTQCSRRP